MFGRSENFVRLRKSGGLGGPGVWWGWEDREDPLVGNKFIFATSCTFCKLFRWLPHRKTVVHNTTLFFMLFKFILIWLMNIKWMRVCSSITFFQWMSQFQFALLLDCKCFVAFFFYSFTDLIVVTMPPRKRRAM
jgi:hypothetical protein